MEHITNVAETQHTSSLDRALDLAAQGYPVFPCRATDRGTKGQPGYRPAKSPLTRNGFHAASTDPAIIRAQPWTADALIGVRTGSREHGGCGFDVLDLDPRHGSELWRAANAEHLRTAGRVHFTRSGGLHLFYIHAPGMGCSTGKLAPGCDLKADGGYAVWWPGFGGQELDDGPARAWPDAIMRQLVAKGCGPGQKTARPKVDLSNATAVAAVAPPSVAAVVELLNRMENPADVDRDEWQAIMQAAADTAKLTGDPEGLIREAALNWSGIGPGNPEQEADKWDSDWMTRPVKGGWPALQRYGRRLAPGYQEEQLAAEFGGPPPPAVAPRPRFTFGAAYVPRDPASIPPREWLYGGHYIRQFITATVAPGGVGKSSLALVEALDMATGRGLLTGKPTGQRHRVIYWNGEDPLIETERRVAAACLHFGITADELGDRLVICSGRDLPIRIAEDTRDGFAIARPLVEEITADLIRSGADALILDPFVKSHGVSENDNNKIDAVASQWAAIADRANVSIELIHHLRKASGTGQDRGAEDARGGVALIAAARSVRVLNVMQPGEADTLGIPDETRRRCFRVDDGKANLQPPRGTGDQAIWRYLASVPLGNGQAGLAADHVGVVTAWVKPAIGDNVTAEHVAEITRRLWAGEPNRRDPRSPDWAGKWIAGVLGVDLAGAGATKRVGKMLDVMVSQGRLGVGSEMDERRRPRATFAPVAPVLQSAENEPEQTGATGAVPGPHPCSTPVDRGCGGLERAKTVAAPVGEVERGKRRPGAADLAAMLAEGRA